MKPPHEIVRGILAAAILAAATTASADQIEPGPNGGKLIGNPPDRAEILIAKDHTVSITFLDAENKPAPPGDRSVALFAQLEGGRKEVALARDGAAFVSNEPLPGPEGYVLVVQIRATPDAKPTNARVKFDMSRCGGCELAEYACTCEEH